MNKDELKDDDKVSTGENMLAVVQTKLAPKCKDPKILTLPCTTVKKMMEQYIFDMKDPYVPRSTTLLMGSSFMKHPSNMPSICSISLIDPRPKQICYLKRDNRMEVRAVLDRYLENLHQQVRSLHSSLTDETRVLSLGTQPWKAIFWISGQKYYHIPFMEWILKKLSKMGGLTLEGNEYMTKGVQVHQKKPG